MRLVRVTLDLLLDDMFDDAKPEDIHVSLVELSPHRDDPQVFAASEFIAATVQAARFVVADNEEAERG